MSRPKRINLPGCVYHVICRGNRSDVIFVNNKDKEKFLEYLAQYIEPFAPSFDGLYGVVQPQASNARSSFCRAFQESCCGNRRTKYIKFVQEGIDIEIKSLILSQRFMGSEDFARRMNIRLKRENQPLVMTKEQRRVWEDEKIMTG